MKQNYYRCLPALYPICSHRLFSTLWELKSNPLDEITKNPLLQEHFHCSLMDAKHLYYSTCEIDSLVGTVIYTIMCQLTVKAFYYTQPTGFPFTAQAMWNKS